MFFLKKTTKKNKLTSVFHASVLFPDRWGALQKSPFQGGRYEQFLELQDDCDEIIINLSCVCAVSRRVVGLFEKVPSRRVGPGETLFQQGQKPIVDSTQ